MQSQFDAYLRDELVPFIYDNCQSPGIWISTMGSSFGAYHAANSLFKHPDVIKRCFAMSGVYDLKNFMDGMYDDNFYFNNPVDYLSNLNDDYYLPLLRKADAILIMSGQGNYEAPERSRALSDILNAKGIPHTLDLWGPDVDHDWPWWRKMLPNALGKLL